jgi:phosphatidylglycerophosphate synthase
MKASYRETLRAISDARRLCQPAKEDWTSRQYRAVSIFISLPLAQSRISANQITLAWIFLSCLGIAALAFPAYWVRVGGATLIVLAELLDFVDGEVARLTQHTSKSGVFLDLTGHDVIRHSLFLVIGYEVFGTTNNLAYLLFALSASVFVSGYHMVPFFYEHADLEAQRGWEGRPGIARPASLLKKSARVLFFLMRQTKHLVLLGVILNQVKWVLIYYACVAPILFLWRAFRFYERFAKSGTLPLKADG